jgi:hypothetical protein
MGGYIAKLLHRAGVDDLPPALTPSLPGLFDPPTDFSPIDRADFQSVVGSLVFILPIRGDVKKEIVYLCGRTSTAVASDELKLTHLLRYLKGCPDIGPTFSSTPSPVTLTASADSAHAVYPTTGRSQSSHTLTIGAPSAPFLTHAGPESTCIPLSPMEAEYVSLARTCKPILYYRQYVSELAPGFPQTTPTPIKQDNQSAINLTISPQIPTKSRYISLRHHFIRDLFQRKIIIPIHENTHDMQCDVMTKYTAPSKFYYDRAQLFNAAPASPLPLTNK